MAPCVKRNPSRSSKPWPCHQAFIAVVVTSRVLFNNQHRRGAYNQPYTWRQEKRIDTNLCAGLLRFTRSHQISPSKPVDGENEKIVPRRISKGMQASIEVLEREMRDYNDTAFFYSRNKRTVNQGEYVWCYKSHYIIHSPL